MQSACNRSSGALFPLVTCGNAGVGCVKYFGGSDMRYAILLLAAASVAWTTSAFAQQTFGGNDCTEDCSGHKAGYKWAEDNDISDPADCNGNSQSFSEGCETYTEDQQRGADEDDDGNDIDD